MYKGETAPLNVVSSKAPAWVQIVLIPFIFELMVVGYKVNLAFSDVIELFDQYNGPYDDTQRYKYRKRYNYIISGQGERV